MGRILSLSCFSAWSGRVAQRRRGLLWPRSTGSRTRLAKKLAAARSWRLQEVAQKSRQVVEKIVARKLVRGPFDLSAPADFARRLSSQSHRAQSRTLVSSLGCCRIRPDCGRMAACFQRSRVPLRDVGLGDAHAASRPECWQGALISAHKTLNDIV
jgi:hypothetical protein